MKQQSGSETEKFSNQPEIKAELEKVIAGIYYGQGKYDLGRKHSRAFIDLLSKLPRQNNVQEIEVSAVRAYLLFDRGELAESERTYRQFLPLMREEQRKGHVKAETFAGTLNAFAFLRRTQGDSKEAEALFREALALAPQLPPTSCTL